MTTDFFELTLQPYLAQAVNELGYVEPTPIQEAVIPLMIARKDVIGQAQTGTGKTAAFALPILNNLIPNQDYVQSLIVVPTRELAIQVAEVITSFGRSKRVRVLAVYGGASYRPQINDLRRGVDVVVGTPGRMIDLIEKKILDISMISTVVLDEADEMLSMGFVEDIETILAQTPFGRQTALFSATMPKEIRRLAEQYMTEPQTVAIKSAQVTLDAIEQRFYLVNDKEKTAALTRLFEVENITSALIFCRTRVRTNELTEELNARGFPAEALNGDLSQEARERTLNRFRQNKINVVVATDVAARGLDIDDISHVFNFDLPDDAEIYVHRIGRTGRAGKTGIAISLVSPSDKRHLNQIEAFTKQKLKRADIPTDEDIIKFREGVLIKQVSMWLKRGRFKKEREMVENLAAEGFDPIEIAAAALKIARADEKQRPIAPVSEVIEARSRNSDRNDRPRRNGERVRTSSPVSHEAGMVRLSLSMGKNHGIRPNDIVGAIASHAEIPGSAIGKITIQDQRSLVDVPEKMVKQILSRAEEVRIHRMPVGLQLAV